ncbi:MAG: GNAT family protein [Armatimonadota bacterium]
MEYGWQGKLVRLVPLDPDRHLETAVQWFNDPRMTNTLGMASFPMSKLEERKFFEHACLKHEHEVRFAIETLEGRHIGFSGIHQIDWINRSALTGSLIGNPDDWGKGYGSDAAAIRAWYCFEVLNLRLLKSGCLNGNVASRKMSEKLGFKEYGRLPEAVYRNGEYRDEVFLYLTREMWLTKTGGKKPGN